MITGLGLLSFWANYFDPIFKTGGEAHRTFRTAQIEPKQQVAALLIADGLLASKAPVLAEDNWLLRPLQYLFANDHDIHINWESGDDKKIVDTLSSNGYVVGFVGMHFQEFLNTQPLPDRLSSWVITDYSNRPLIIVWHRQKP